MKGAIVLVSFELTVLGIICFFLLRVFVSFKRTPWYALVSTWLGWLLCFSIVFMVPLDILDTDHENCLGQHNNSEVVCKEPVTYLPGGVMVVQWKILWWGTMILSWLAFPLLSSYFLSGDFSVWEKFVRSLKENVILYLVLGALGAIGLIGLLVTTGLSKDAFVNYLLGLANAYGLILTVCLMGYGLVDIPRYMWRKASRSSTLRYYCVMAFKYKEGIETAKSDLLKTLKVVKTIADKVRDHDPYRPYVDTILAKCPREYDDVTGDSDIELSYAKLVSIHAKVSEDTHAMLRAVCLYEQMLKKAFKTEDIIRTKTHPQSEWKVYWSFKPARTHKFAKVVDFIEYIWEIKLWTTAFRTLAVLTGLLSFGIVWCELTLMVDKSDHDLSPFSNIIKSIPLVGLAKQIFCLIIIFYMALCAYTTLFKIKIFNYYRLVPHQMSDANSIMFSSNYLCRLAAPLSYNFLSLINAKDDSFDTVMGSMNTESLGRRFMVFFPIFVAVLCLATIFNVYSKIGAMCCIKRFRYQPTDDEKLIDEGERILQEERENKEGKGAIQLTIKQNIRSHVRDEVSKIAKKDEKETKELEKEKDIYVPPEPTPAAPAAPATLSAVIASKYGFNTPRANDDLLPSTSRFSTKRGSFAPPPIAEPVPETGMRKNLSNNNLPSTATPEANGTAATSTGGFLRFNFSSNSLSSQTGSVNAPPAATSSSNSRFLAAPTPAAPTVSPSQPSSKSRPPIPSDMLPPTSRFAQKHAPSPAPAPAAILVTAPPGSAENSSNGGGKNADNRSLLGGLFGGKSAKGFSLLPDTSPNPRRG